MKKMGVGYRLVHHCNGFENQTDDGHIIRSILSSVVVMMAETMANAQK